MNSIPHWNSAGEKALPSGERRLIWYGLPGRDVLSKPLSYYKGEKKKERSYDEWMKNNERKTSALEKLHRKMADRKAPLSPIDPEEFERKRLLREEQILARRFWATLRRNPVKPYQEGDKRIRYISKNDPDGRKRGSKVAEQYINGQWVRIPHERDRYVVDQWTLEEMNKVSPAKLISDQFDRAKLVGIRMRTISERLQDQMQRGGRKVPEWQLAVDNWRSASRLVDKYRKINPSAFDNEYVYDRVWERDELLDNMELALENADRFSKSVNV